MSVMADKNAATVTLPGGYSVEVSPATGNYEVKISKSGDVSGSINDFLLPASFVQTSPFV